ncbi:MAG: hypothetical protein NTY15_04150 [Planctomycetota bacterium]|nr:hypothetical protein [Planctomycetota bacterium]
MKWTLLGFLGLGCILTIASASGVRLLGQQPNQQPNGGGSNRQSQPNGQFLEQNQRLPYSSAFPGGELYAGPSGPVPRDPRHEEGRQALREAQSKLRAPDASESDKKEARAAIEKFLEDEFERDQKMRREQVTRLEEQVSKLRKQLDKREQSKSKIIELRMQLMENDAEGLSFPESFNELQRFDGPNVMTVPFVVPPNSSSGYIPNGSFVPYPQYPANFGSRSIPNPPIQPNVARPTEPARAN